MVRRWNDLALDTVRQTNASDAQAARLYAMVNVAMYDAVNGLATGHGVRTPAIVAPERGTNGDPRLAAAQAAHDVLVALYPDRSATYDAQLSADLAEPAPPGQARHGRAWGARVASGVLRARAADGSTPVVNDPAQSGPGRFRGPFNNAQFRDLEPFAIGDPDEYVSDGPPALDSAEYAGAFNEVKELGSAAVPDDAALATFRFWSLGSNSAQPPGAWLQVAQAVSESEALSLPDTARLFALESMAMADTVAPTYTTKGHYFFWRPTTAIREADTDGNPATVADPTWSARAGSVGSSPEHWSGHSSFSAAAAPTLAGFFCRDDISFSLRTDAPNTQTRTYSSFSQAADEAGRSRILGGFHFEFSNQDGLAAGRGVASEVLANELLRTRGTTHAGACPL